MVLKEGDKIPLSEKEYYNICHEGLQPSLKDQILTQSLKEGNKFPSKEKITKNLEEVYHLL